jgi:hypothetical protein
MKFDAFDLGSTFDRLDSILNDDSLWMGHLEMRALVADIAANVDEHCPVRLSRGSSVAEGERIEPVPFGNTHQTVEVLEQSRLLLKPGEDVQMCVYGLIPGTSPAGGVGIIAVLEILWERIEGWVAYGVEVAHCALDARVRHCLSRLAASVVVLAGLLDETVRGKISHDAAYEQRVWPSWVG